MPAPRLQRFLTASVFAILSLALGGASCDKKSVANPAEPGPNVPFEPPPGAPGQPPPPAKAAKPSGAAAEPKEPTPAAPAANHVAELLEKLPSPCGKAMSLKKTIDSDPGCKQAPFAKRFVDRLAALELTDEQITEVYGRRYGEHETYTFAVANTPFIGSPNAPVVVVEFFDYACPHCREAAPMLEEVVAKRSKDVVLYYKNYPLHKDSMDPAKAAIAAYRQGKFMEMHKTLFAHQGSLSREEVFGYAKELGLDMKKFEKDWSDPAAEAKVNADKAEGSKANLQGTPTLYLNGHMYADLLTPDSLNDWIDEELAVNR